MSRRKKTAPFSLFAFQDIITSVTGIILLITMMMAIELVQTLSRAAAAPQEQKSTHVGQLLQHTVADNVKEIERLEKILNDTNTVRFDADSLRRKLAAMKAAAGEMESQQEHIQSTQEKITARQQQQQQALELTPESIAALTQEQAKIAQQIAAMKRSNRVIFNRPAGASQEPWLVELNPSSIETAKMGVVSVPETFETAESFLQWTHGKDSNSVYFVLLVKPDTIDTFMTIRERLHQNGFDVGYDVLPSNHTAISPQTGAGTP